ncbi:potassium-transporting ATPase subunit KdpC [Diplocloster agilis]|uniref:potassium-transporting ATPase subunit KdpC n=1 Tax=Diplocloster agilis TaxID=2850323 RepID=UPI0008223ADD|nr:potassium-transporting ATPase subunit KdpC [Suonthocola fibrivorans]MCU6732829.1 potassium-transporting ATPase subunit KdpC [Suonthocola fibrivorans]SCI64515.1 potassium-transporting ATPase subunit C [uncultured Clostridium sp.]
MKTLKAVVPRMLVFFILLMVITGLVYPLVVTGISKVFFNDKATGSIIEIDGKKYGSSLLAQEFTSDDYLWGRIMNLDTGTYQNEEGETLAYSWASNKTPAGEELESMIAERVEKIRRANPDREGEAIPVDLVTSSGSGLDPHISPAAAEYQVPRIAKARGITEDELRAVIDRYTDGKFLGIFGEKRVNVLEVNLALDGILK